MLTDDRFDRAFDEWDRLAQRLDREERERIARRGRFVAIAARVALGLLVASIGLLASIALGRFM